MLSLQIAVGALTAMKEASDGNVARYAVGSDPSQYKLFTGGHFWARADRPGMTKIYQQVLFSSMATCLLVRGLLPVLSRLSMLPSSVLLSRLLLFPLIPGLCLPWFVLSVPSRNVRLFVTVSRSMSMFRF